jgi:hypothetical protein
MISNRINGVGNELGMDLYNEVHRLICEWNGDDASERSGDINELVEKIVALAKMGLERAPLAAHDTAEAA